LLERVLVPGGLIRDVREDSKGGEKVGDKSKKKKDSHGKSQGTRDPGPKEKEKNRVLKKAARRLCARCVNKL